MKEDVNLIFRPQVIAFQGSTMVSVCTRFVVHHSSRRFLFGRLQTVTLTDRPTHVLKYHINWRYKLTAKN